MSYNLQPISTLSAVLGQDNQQHQQQQQHLQIAPELLDDTANHSVHQHDSSERNGHQQWTTDSHYQVDESTDDLRFFDTQQQQQAIEDQPPPRKKAKSRASANNIDLANIINEATVAEYEDPQGDWRSGVVYVHPAATANQACVRCHRIKRKCDNARPRCAGCWKADTPCVFEISPATAGLVVNLKNEQSRTTNELQLAQQRVAELEAQLSHSSASINHDHIPHQSGSSFPHPPAEVERYYSGFAQTILGIDQAQNELQVEVGQSSSHQQILPTLDVLQLAAATFFDAYHVQYPFLNRGGFMVDLQNIWTTEQGSNEVSVDQRRKFVVIMITSVGAYLCEQKGDMGSGFAQNLRERAMRNMGSATSKTDLTTIQAYLALLSSVLLGLHPEIKVHNILALAMQTAISLDLHRESTSPLANDKLRKRIWWTIYNLDRSLAVGLGRPLGIADSEVDADLPTVEIAEDTHTPICNAIIAHRRILRKIYVGIYSHGGTLSDSDIGNREQEIHDWRKTWPGDQASQTYAQLLSLQALCLLYRYGPSGASIRAQSDRLQNYAQEAISIYQNSNSTTSSRDLLPLAWRYQVVITLLYTTSQATDMDHDQMKAQIETCRQIVAVGQDHVFVELAKLKTTFEQLAELVLGSSGDLAEAGNRVLAGLYSPSEHDGSGNGLDENRERATRELEVTRTETPRWNYLI